MSVLKKRGGFTLIEIIVSITFISLVWLAIYISLSVNTMFMSQVKHRAQAVFIAQQQIDSMRLISAYSGLANIVNKTVTIDNRDTTPTGDDLTGIMNVIVEADPGSVRHYRQVTVTINWNERMLGGLTSILTESLATIISDDPAG